MIHPSGMFWRPRESVRRRDNVYRVTGNVRFSQLGKWCQLILRGGGGLNRFNLAYFLVDLIVLGCVLKI